MPNASTLPRSRPPTKRVHWLNLGFVLGVHLLAAGGLALYLLLLPLTLSACIIGWVGISLTVFSISAGYHRLFAHRTYEASPVLRTILLVLGAGAFQNSALNWAAAHRQHHRYVDTERDPYNAKRGFWYSHIGWVFEQTGEPVERMPVADLQQDALLRWQHRFLVPLGLGSGFVLPWLIGWLAGDPWGGLLFGGLLRLVVAYHATFSINSFVHLIGKQPYSERDTSRDSLVAALLTMGEGYHNYHHTFPSDYRNGVYRHQFDPTKWLLRGLEWLGFAKNLRRTPAHVVARARVRTDEQRLGRQPIHPHWSDHIERARLALHHTLSEWAMLSRERTLALQASAAQLRGSGAARLNAKCNAVGQRFWHGYRDWQTLLRQAKREQALLA